MSIAPKLRDMHALSADTCDPEYRDALLEAAGEIERLRAALKEAKGALAICEHPSAGSGDGLTIWRNGKPIGAIIDRALAG